MANNELTYNDFLQRLNIQELLVDAGYQLNKRDGLRYPSYVKVDSHGQRVRGDKFIVTGNGKCCFQPPEQKNYNVIGFIKEHPTLFDDYKPGMSLDRLVNVVCNRLLNNPIDVRESRVAERNAISALMIPAPLTCVKAEWQNPSEMPSPSTCQTMTSCVSTQGKRTPNGNTILISRKEASTWGPSSPFTSISSWRPSVEMTD